MFPQSPRGRGDMRGDVRRRTGRAPGLFFNAFARKGGASSSKSGARPYFPRSLSIFPSIDLAMSGAKPTSRSTTFPSRSMKKHVG